MKGCSKQPDLNNLVGLLWYVAGQQLSDFWCDYVPSKLNLADAPSRQNFDTMKRLGFRLLELQFDEYAQAAETWLKAVDCRKLLDA